MRRGLAKLEPSTFSEPAPTLPALATLNGRPCADSIEANFRSATSIAAHPLNIVQGLGALAAALLMRKSGSTLAWKTVEQWLHDHARRDNYGSGYSGNALLSGSSNSYVELRKEPRNGGVRVIASVYLDPRQGAVASKAWEVSKLDAQLEKRFGQHLRFRIDI